MHCKTKRSLANYLRSLAGFSFLLVAGGLNAASDTPQKSKTNNDPPLSKSIIEEKRASLNTTTLPATLAVAAVNSPLDKQTAVEPPKGPVKDKYWWVPYVISGLAFVVSVSNWIYSILKDRKARRFSIEDDYWLRKVIGPITIEPMTKTILEMIGSAPKNLDSILLKNFHDIYFPKLSDLAATSSVLSLINDSLSVSTAADLDHIQELIIRFCFAAETVGKEEELEPINHSDFQSEVKTRLISIMNRIKSFQMDRMK